MLLITLQAINLEPALFQFQGFTPPGGIVRAKQLEAILHLS